jgi:hypothetical protein
VMMKMMVIMVIKATKMMRRKTKGLSSGEGHDDNGKSRDPHGGLLTITV